jgi:hypothetical protein
VEGVWGNREVSPALTEVQEVRVRYALGSREAEGVSAFGGGGALSRLPGATVRRGAGKPPCCSSSLMTALALDHSERSELRDAAGEPGALDDLDDALDVLVRERSLLGEALVGRTADDDPVRFKLSA